MRVSSVIRLRPVSYTHLKITPLQTSTSGDRTCRLLEGDFARTSTTETWKFWFCKQPDGTWKASAN